MVLGAVSVAYNVPGVQSGLKLDGPTVADIFLGKVTNWNAKEIGDLNPGVTLPNLPVGRVGAAPSGLLEPEAERSDQSRVLDQSRSS